MRTKIIIGNWKMNRDRKETIDFLITLNHMISKNHLLTDHLNIVLAPSFLSLIAAKTYINRGGLFTKNWLKKLIISAQDANSEIAGSYTGAVSYNQLKEEGIQYSIIGHYETRRMFHYTDEDINKKIISLTNNGMSAILCVGDSKEDKDNNVSISVVLEQVEKALKGVLIDNLENIIIAYEPIYSIGIGVPVPVGDIIEMINAIRNKISQLYSVDASNIIRIIYGGSINSANYIEYVNEDEIDGLLIGKTSLDVTAFYDIIYGTSQVITNKYPALGNNYYLLKKKELANTSKELPFKIKPKKEEIKNNNEDVKNNLDKEIVNADIQKIQDIKNSEINSIKNEENEAN